MRLIHNLEFYEYCKKNLVECFGDENLAVERICSKNSKYSSLYLLESLSSIKESLGSKLINLVSKKLGGTIHKIDAIVARMKTAEDNFIERENRIEKEYIPLFRNLVYLKYKATDKSKIGVVQGRLQELEAFMRDLVNSYNSIMEDLEKQINIITKENNRRIDYYNLKRSRDSAIAKKKRAEYKYKLVQGEHDPDVAKKIEELFGAPDVAQADAKHAEEVLKKAEERVSKYQPDPEWKSITFRNYEEKMKDAVITSAEFRDRIYNIVKEEEKAPILDGREYNNKKVAFVGKRTTAIKRIEGKIEFINKMLVDDSSDQMKDAVKFYQEKLEKIKAATEGYEFPPFTGKRKPKKPIKPTPPTPPATT